jgi:DNA-binding transcriptional LysR family regulator
VILDPRRLRFLLAVARYGGVLAAADELQVTASAVSQQLAKLERETGHALLRRTPTGSLLTPAGQALAEAAEDVERALALARSRLEQDDATVSGTVRIGGFQSFLANVLAPSLTDWRARYPALVIETVEAEEAELLRVLRAGTVDGFIVELDAGERYTPPRGTADVPLLDEPWKLVVPSGALLTTDVIDIGRLGLPWLGVDPSAASAKAIQRVRRLLGGDSSSVHTFYSFQNALALVAAGEGVTLIPSLAIEGLGAEGVDALDIPGLGMRRVALRHLTRSRGASPSLDTAISLIREAAASFSYEASDS